LSASGLCAASAPVLSLTTRYSGFSFDAATSWPLIVVCAVSFFLTVPCTVPCDDSQVTLSPALKALLMIELRRWSMSAI